VCANADDPLGQTIAATIAMEERTLPQETQTIALFLLKYVDTLLVDGNGPDIHNFDPENEDPFFLQHKESKEFKAQLTTFLKTYIHDKRITLDGRRQSVVNEYASQERSLNHGDAVQIEDEIPENAHSVENMNPGNSNRVAQLARVSVGGSQPSHEWDSTLLEILQMVKSAKVADGGSRKRRRTEDDEDDTMELSSPSFQRTMDMVDIFSLKFRFLRKALDVFKTLESKDQNVETLFAIFVASKWRKEG
jgi:hypothetical protein